MLQYVDLITRPRSNRNIVQSTSTGRLLCCGRQPSLSSVQATARHSEAIASDEIESCHRKGTCRCKLCDLAKPTSFASIHGFLGRRSPFLICHCESNTFKIPQCTEPGPKSLPASIGTLVYLAESLGLHRNTQGPHLSVVESQVRRLLWYQICFLDLQVAESSGTQPRIRDDGFDTPLPFNINDKDLNRSSYSLESTNSWTETTFALVRAECYLVHRLMLRQIIAIENKSSDINAARRLIDQRRSRIEERYLSNLDDKISIHRCVKLVSRLLIAKWDVTLLCKHVQADANSPFQHALRDMYGTLLLHHFMIVLS